MKKCEMPQPKYSIGDQLIYQVMPENAPMPSKEIGKVDKIVVVIMGGISTVGYNFMGSEESVSEERIFKRIKL